MKEWQRRQDRERERKSWANERFGRTSVGLEVGGGGALVDLLSMRAGELDADAQASSWCREQLVDSPALAATLSLITPSCSSEPSLLFMLLFSSPATLDSPIRLYLVCPAQVLYITLPKSVVCHFSK